MHLILSALPHIEVINPTLFIRGANSNYILEEERLGTAGALSLIKENLDDPFFVMNGDILTKLNLNEIFLSLSIKPPSFNLKSCDTTKFPH